LGPSRLQKLVRTILSVAVATIFLGWTSGEDASVFETAANGVDRNDAWKPYYERIDGALMALVPAGCFMMGGDGFHDEQPIHEVCIEEPFWIDAYEVTAAEFAAFMNESGVTEYHGCDWITGYNSAEEQFTRIDGQWAPKEGYERSAAFGITWHEATAYCACRGARLPTEAEWAYAARGPDSLVYPWGNELVTENIARYKGQMPIIPGGGVPLIIGTKPAGASWVGAFDMIGNVCEWVSSLYRPYPYDADDGREAGGTVDAQSPRAMRGWAWYHPNWVDPVRANDRFCSQPDATTRFFGFRCASDYSP